MAEFILKSRNIKGIYCESRATSYEESGEDIYPPAKKCLKDHGIPFTYHESKRISQEDYDEFDEIYVMENRNLRDILRIVDDRDHKIKLLCDYDIADPWFTGDFEGVYAQINEGLDKVI